MDIGFVGLGNMGGALVRRLLLSRKLRAFDINPDAVQAGADKGADTAASPAELAANSDVVLTCLPTSKEVRSVIFGDEGLVDGLARGNVVVDMTTGDPAETRSMAAELAERGIEMIDAPVSGGPMGADAGTIAIMVGGSDELFVRLRPVFEDISPNVFHAGGVGAGHTIKLVNNLTSAGNRAVAMEAITLAAKNGLNPRTAMEIMQKGSGRSFMTEVVFPNFILTDKIEQGFTLGLMHKDVSLAVKMGDDSNTPLKLGNITRQILQTAIDEMGPDADLNTLIRLYENAANVTVSKG
ncbi:MAG: NAD(P)-dependent oxidoreductase [Pseudomonadota bacterium]|nr:NAD(P)-dependent oxidoreductase [Pseudomonadota bacterium]